MKKKIKYLTFEELVKLCDSHGKECDDCPFYYGAGYCKLSPDYIPAKEELFEQEVEL